MTTNSQRAYPGPGQNAVFSMMTGASGIASMHFSDLVSKILSGQLIFGVACLYLELGMSPFLCAK